MPRFQLPSLRVVSHHFRRQDICAGHVALDFVNTAAGLNQDPRDWLEDFSSLLQWAATAHALDEKLLVRLADISQSHPKKSFAALKRAREFRAGLYTLVHHRRAGIAPSPAAVKMLERWARRAGAAQSLRFDGSGFLQPSLESCGLDAITAFIAMKAVELFSAAPQDSFGVCAGRNCGWVFLDTSPTHRRRWCDMKTCGNAAKANRHYHRKHGPA